MANNQYALTTLSAIQDYRLVNGESIKTTPEINTLITNLINAVSDKFEKYCGRLFLSREVVEYQDGGIVDTIFTKQYPINSVTSIHYDSNWVWDASTLISSTAYRIANGNSIVFNSASDLSYRSKQSLKIVYNAGYDTVPYDLENACIMEVLRALKKIEEIGVSEKRSSDFFIKYITAPFLEESLQVLNIYKVKGAY